MKLSILITTQIGAPEYPGRSTQPVSQAIDIWSLACVFSLASTWIVHNHSGVNLFHKIRQRAIKQEIEAQRSQTQSRYQTTTVSEGDHFHNGREVLNAVTDWHTYLRNTIRKTDAITCQVLDLVDQKMLLGIPEQRINATDLCSQLAVILKLCRHKKELQLPEPFMILLGEIDEEDCYSSASMRRSRPAAQENSRSSTTVTHTVHKSAFVERPLITTHRQSIWPDQSLRLQDGKYPEHQELKLQTVPEQADINPDTVLTPRSPPTQHRFSSDASVQRLMTRSRRSGSTKTHPPQNYFQACEAIKKRERKEKTYIFHPFSQKDDKRDTLLVSYFRGTRDIVSGF